MPSATPAMFRTVPRDHLSLLQGTKPKAKQIVDFLDFSKGDIARATGVPRASVRYDAKMPAELVERFREWANLFNLVAEFFQGDAKKTALWFTMPNPTLGNIAPRDMIRFGRYRRLLKFIMDALAENPA